MRDLTNLTFGKRRVLGFSAKRHSHYYWRVQCECGDVREVTAHNLLRGKADRCPQCAIRRIGVKRRQPLNVGQIFGQRTVLEIYYGIDKKQQAQVLCVCGHKDVVRVASLKSGTANQCRECSGKMIGLRTVTHGQARSGKITTEFRIWTGMLDRCTNPRSDHWVWYGGRGIQVCDRWRTSFENFFADMGPRPSGRSLDRFPNNDGNYEPGNCRWATPKEQIANQRKHGLIEKFTTDELLAEIQRRGVN